jgi:hypothetical protein
MPKRYLLQSEIERARSKAPVFELVLPPVLYTDDDRDEHGNLPDGVDAGAEKLPEATLRVKPAILMTDEVTQLSARDVVSAARLHLGEADYDRFRLSGGTAQILFSIINENAGATTGE